MAGTKRVKKTVAFFEVRGEHEEELQPVDWQSLLAELDDERVEAGSIDVLSHEFNGAPHWVQVYTKDDEYHLVLAREREEPPSSLNRTTGEIIDEEMDANQPWVEVAILSFFPGTNIFGLVLGSGAAPRAGALADWINSHEIFEELVTVTPHLSEELVARLNSGSSEARLVSMRMSSEQIASQHATEGLYSQARAFARELDLGPEVEVEVILKVRGRVDQVTDDTKRRLGDLGRSLMGEPLDAASVEIVNEVDGSTDREIVNLIKHRMATKERVSVLDEEGQHQVRIPSAIVAISRAASRLNIRGHLS